MRDKGERVTIRSSDVGTIQIGAAGPRIAEAVGALSMSPNRRHAKQIEAAMASAVTHALAEGVEMDDSETIRARMLAAREAVKQTHGA